MDKHILGSLEIYCQIIHGLLVSYDCYNKLLQTWWLNTIEIYFLTVLETKSLRSVLHTEIKVFPGSCSFWNLPGRICSLYLLVSRGSRISKACGFITLISAFMVICFLFCQYEISLYPYHLRIHMIAFRAHTEIQDNLSISRSLS